MFLVNGFKLLCYINSLLSFLVRVFPHLSHIDIASWCFPYFALAGFAFGSSYITMSIVSFLCSPLPPCVDSVTLMVFRLEYLCIVELIFPFMTSPFSYSLFRPILFCFAGTGFPFSQYIFSLSFYCYFIMFILVAALYIHVHAFISWIYFYTEAPCGMYFFQKTNAVHARPRFYIFNILQIHVVQ